MLVSTPCFPFSDPTFKRKAHDFVQRAVFSTVNRQLQTVNGYKKCFLVPRLCVGTHTGRLPKKRMSNVEQGMLNVEGMDPVNPEKVRAKRFYTSSFCCSLFDILPFAFPFLVPMLCVGMHTGRLCLPFVKVDCHMTLMPACIQKPRRSLWEREIL